jgi:POT family proton-dependent oligopeptide transporter
MVGALVVFALGKPFYAREPERRDKTPAERQEQRATLGLFCVIVSLLLWYFAYKFGWLPPVLLAAVALAIVAAAVKVYSMFTPDMRATLTRLFGVFALIVLWWVAYEHNDSIWVFFARDYMDHKFTVPEWLPGWLGGGAQYEPKADAYQFINSLFVLIFIPVFNLLFRAIDPGMKVFTSVRKILIGLLLTAASSGIMMLAASLTNGGTVKVSALWMVLAYIVLTAGEVLVYGTMLDLSYAAAPKSMKGFITACFLLTNTLGNFINSVIAPTYGGSLNVAPEERGALSPEQFFAMSAGIVLVATVAFYFVGKRFERGYTPAA